MARYYRRDSIYFYTQGLLIHRAAGLTKLQESAWTSMRRAPPGQCLFIESIKVM